MKLISKKGIGRTTRMLREAIRLAREGQNVVIITSTGQHRNQIRHQLFEMGDMNTSRLIQVVSRFAIGNKIDWGNMQIVGESTIHADYYALLVDHTVIEQEFSYVLTAWTQFDEATEQDTVEQKPLPVLLNRRMKLGAPP